MEIMAGSRLEKKLIDREREISRCIKEVSYCFDKNGNVIFKKDGSRTAVKYSMNDKINMRDNILTHNHPFQTDLEKYGTGNTSVFSSADLIIAYQNKPKQFRMVIGDERHSIQWTGATKAVAQDLIERLKILEKDCNERIERVYEKIYTGKYKSIEQYYREYCTAVKRHTIYSLLLLTKWQRKDYIFTKEIVKLTA
ncbi:MAG: hypothetical protein LBH95_02920 [Oscillospiraceae bacterium]|nr:hypothetical protein [Oscillospiraceae bacterium]